MKWKKMSGGAQALRTVRCCWRQLSKTAEQPAVALCLCVYYVGECIYYIDIYTCIYIPLLAAGKTTSYIWLVFVGLFVWQHVAGQPSGNMLLLRRPKMYTKIIWSSPIPMKGNEKN